MHRTYGYFPVTPAQKQWGIYVTCVGHHTTRPGDTFPSPAHPDEYYFTWNAGRTLHEWQIVIVKSGRGEVEFRNLRAKLNPGSMMVIPPGCWHRYRPDAAIGWTTYWIGFGGDFADRMMATVGPVNECRVQSLDADSAIIQMFSATVADLLSDDGKTPFSAAARIPLLVATILETPVGNAPPTASLVLKAQTYITDHQSETIDFDELARSLGISYRSFRYLFTKETKESPLQYQLKRRLLRAKNLLVSSDMPIKEIARSLGFRSTWYFAHFFRNRTTQSPASYRRQHERSRGASS